MVLRGHFNSEAPSINASRYRARASPGATCLITNHPARFAGSPPWKGDLCVTEISAVGAVYDRAYFVDSRKNARS